ncbi:hypothetical protein COLO4_20325 [Corchorus olitorius]|uniref:Uncharacterized protein n=1 Tax=Corchorus olitorius TaxID=93759 RepID=A0A1R3J0A5_9ROSI|nr:hypothetical protein COLO4_20325 [Corchorus olitorius]
MGENFLVFSDGRGESVEDESLCEREGGNSVVDWNKARCARVGNWFKNFRYIPLTF